MSREDRIKDVLGQLQPLMLEIENESHKHRGSSTETHFKVLIVSPLFENLSRVVRQRRVQELLKEEFDHGLHALSIRALSPAEYEQGGADDFISPSCRGQG